MMSYTEISSFPEQFTLGEMAYDLKAKDVMRYGVMSVELTDPLHQAVSLLAEKNISGLAVTNQGKLVGIIADKDLLRLMNQDDYLPGQVQEYMTPSPICFEVEDRLADICQCFIDNSFRRVPILFQGKLAGMMTRADLIAAFLKRFQQMIDNTIPSSMREKPQLCAENVMTHGLHTLYPEFPLLNAMEIIVNHHITGVPIINKQWDLVGILTEKDILLAIGCPDVVSATVADYMTQNVITAERMTPLGDICNSLIDHEFHRIPIVEQNKLAGIVTRSDVLKARIASFKL